MAIARSRGLDQLRERVPEPRDPGRLARAARGRTETQAGVDELIERWRFAHLLGPAARAGGGAAAAPLLRRRDAAEIAAATGIPLGTVKMRMVQGLARLRDLVDAEERGS